MLLLTPQGMPDKSVESEMEEDEDFPEVPLDEMLDALQFGGGQSDGSHVGICCAGQTMNLSLAHLVAVLCAHLFLLLGSRVEASFDSVGAVGQ